MKRILALVILTMSIPCLAAAQPKARASGKYPVKYGANAAAGRTFTHDGVKLYYEVYGAGQPLIVVHGNGGSIVDLAAQIAHFRKQYKVIAMDSRSHGKSADSPTKLTYESMADDLAALIDHLKVGPAYVLGWSDGGIEALLIGMRHPAKVKKIAAMAANLNPTEDAVRPEIIAFVKTMLEGAPASLKDSPNVRREMAVTQLLLDEPHINPQALEAITAPTLVLAGDHDVIRDEHTVEIFQHIPNSQLGIFPNATHMIPFDDPVLFNMTVDRFFRTPFVKKDRVKDLLTSLEKMRGQ
jgi:pimeloyl-ACP methyl ester carboxylesterase